MIYYYLPEMPMMHWMPWIAFAIAIANVCRADGRILNMNFVTKC
jgi:hypothetical protein